MKKAFITGINGFVGRHMHRYLVDTDYEVSGIDLDGGIGFIEWLREASEYARDYDLVVHAAAAGPNRRAIDTELANFPYNVQLDAALFEWAITTKARRVVYLSSSAVYPAFMQTASGMISAGYQLKEMDTEPIEEPADVYGLTKLFGERMAAQAVKAGVPVTIVRTFSGYGTRQSEDFPFRAFIERGRRREDPFTIWGSAHQVRDFIHIDDVVRGTMELVEQSVVGPVNLCTGIGTSMLELAQRVVEAFDYDPEIKVDENAPLGVHYRVGDPSRLHMYYQPRVTLGEGIQRAVMGE